MGHKYQAVQWNKSKIVYDFVLLLAALLFIAIFTIVGARVYPSGHTAHPVILLIRAFGVAAFALLTVTLMIGPLARLTPRFRPFLYNRRHLGVFVFLLALVHFTLALAWYHSAGPLNPFVSLFISNPLYDSIPGFPFESLGFIALLILLVMASTSHDFWLNNLTAPVWKGLHMLVYPAYALLVLHIMLGALLTEKSTVFPILTGASFVAVASLHLAAGMREWRHDNGMKRLKAQGWIDVCAPHDIADKRAIIAPLPKGDRVAVFRDGDKVFAVTNACRHQNGPLGEGRIIDGCITCPWHGWQYRPEDGVSPPPFTEKIATYNVRIEQGRILLNPKPNAPGTHVAPTLIPEALETTA